MIKRYKLLIPGPTECPDYVLKEMGMQVLPHYESEWAEIYWEIVRYLQEIIGTKSDVFPINGSGTLAFELPMASLLKEGDKVLAVANSFYGHLMGVTAEKFGAKVVYAENELYKPYPREKLLKILEKEKFSLVVTAHHDTASGFLNPIDKIGSLCRQYDVPLLVDCVSSIGGVPFEMDKWGVDFCCSSVQKCLDCPPGLSIVAVSPKAWSKIEKVGKLNRGRYMSLLEWREASIKDKNTHPNMVTVATNNMMALRESLKHILAEGVEKRLDRYIRIGKILRKGIRNMGLETLVEDQYSPILTRVIFPKDIDPEEVRDFVRYNYGILVGIYFRIAHFGSAVSEDYITLVLIAIADFLKRKGYSISYETCLNGIEKYRNKE